MIFHASIPADDPERVARVLGELLGGGSSPFHVGRHSFMARGGADDEHRTAIEVYPRDEVMMPGTGASDMVQQGRLENPPRYGCFHLAVGTKLSRDEIIAIGKREGWRALYCSRGPFDLVEFWVENSLMIEFLDPEMQAQYKALVTGARSRTAATAPAA
jgi:hypothetical protein